MKRLSTFIILCAICCLAVAQDNKKFSPQKYQEELEQYIVKEAGFSKKETETFLSMMRENDKKKRSMLHEMRKLGRDKQESDDYCRKIIIQRDNIEMKVKKLQKDFHEKLLEQLPASKVLKAIKAEERFHRRQLRKWSHNPPGNKRMP